MSSVLGMRLLLFASPMRLTDISANSTCMLGGPITGEVAVNTSRRDVMVFTAANGLGQMRPVTLKESPRKSKILIYINVSVSSLLLKWVATLQRTQPVFSFRIAKGTQLDPVTFVLPVYLIAEVTRPASVLNRQYRKEGTQFMSLKHCVTGACLR